MDTFFDALEKQYREKLPFVIYSRPINSIIKCWLQKDSTLHYTQSFKESGFVFAPFDLMNPAVLFPKSDCFYNDIETSRLVVDEVFAEQDDFSNYDKLSHEKLVSKAVSSISEGQLNKVVLSRFIEKKMNDIKPIEIFKRLFNTYKNAMVYCWYHPAVGLWLGATPELLFKVEGQQLTTISLAGTQPYENGIKPTWEDKELDEQQIVTDYLAEQIEPFTISTKISEVESVRAGKLWHLKTRLISRMKLDVTLETVINALHPTPAVCGFPKEEAKNFILQNEGYNREFYTGFLGELNLSVSTPRNTNKRNVENSAYSVVKKYSNFYVNLRCMQVKDNKAIIYVGGGITRGSNPQQEYEETQNKAKTISTILR